MRATERQRGVRAAPRLSDTERKDMALLYFHQLAFGRYRRGWPVDWEETCRRMAWALGWRGEAEEG